MIRLIIYLTFFTTRLFTLPVPIVVGITYPPRVVTLVDSLTYALRSSLYVHFARWDYYGLRLPLPRLRSVGSYGTFCYLLRSCRCCCVVVWFLPPVRCTRARVVTPTRTRLRCCVPHCSGYWLCCTPHVLPTFVRLLLPCPYAFIRWLLLHTTLLLRFRCTLPHLVTFTTPLRLIPFVAVAVPVTLVITVTRTPSLPFIAPV